MRVKNGSTSTSPDESVTVTAEYEIDYEYYGKADGLRTDGEGPLAGKLKYAGSVVGC